MIYEFRYFLTDERDYDIKIERVKMEREGEYLEEEKKVMNGWLDGWVWMDLEVGWV